MRAPTVRERNHLSRLASDCLHPCRRYRRGLHWEVVVVTECGFSSGLNVMFAMIGLFIVLYGPILIIAIASWGDKD